MRHRTVLTLAGCVAAVAACGVMQSADPVEWVGRPAADLAALFGEADKTERRSDGSTRLTYKVYRLGRRPASAEGLIVIELPGVGWIGRPIARSTPSAAAVGIEPLELDETGLRTNGGVSREETYERSLGKGEDRSEPRQPDAAPAPRHRGKLKLAFEIGAGGLIESWSAKD